MAKVRAGTRESVYKIERWLGVNEAQEGEARLKAGEAAVMRNFRVTAGGALRKRPGSAAVAGLLSAYTVEADSSVTEVLLKESGANTAQFVMYPTAEADSVGAIELTGAPVTVTAANAAQCEGYYYRDAAGRVHRFAALAHST